MRLLISYVLFAVIASIANILLQEIFLRYWMGSFAISLSILFGTGIGLIIKYILDKKYIFNYQTTSVSKNGKIFFIYALMGIFTTGIFWLFEFGFDYMFNDKYLRYLGAAIGLALGYFIKYQLDKHFVFNNRYLK